MATLIAALADTHVPDKSRSLPDALIARLRTVDCILHAGDITSGATLNYLSTLAPTEAVCGNVDDAFLQTTLPKSRVLYVQGFRIGLIHGDGTRSTTMERARRAFDDVDCIIFGHSHMPTIERRDDVLMVNPGSPTDKRRAAHPSFALLTIAERLDAELVYLL